MNGLGTLAYNTDIKVKSNDSYIDKNEKEDV